MMQPAQVVNAPDGSHVMGNDSEEAEFLAGRNGPRRWLTRPADRSALAGWKRIQRSLGLAGHPRGDWCSARSDVARLPFDGCFLHSLQKRKGQLHTLLECESICMNVLFQCPKDRASYPFFPLSFPPDVNSFLPNLIPRLIKSPRMRWAPPIGSPRILLPDDAVVSTVIWGPWLRNAKKTCVKSKPHSQRPCIETTHELLAHTSGHGRGY